MRFLWGYWVCPVCGESRPGILNLLPAARCTTCHGEMRPSHTPTLPRPAQEACTYQPKEAAQR